MFRDRRWTDLLTLIDWLPRNCAYIEALSEDEEVAEEFLSTKGNDRPRGAGPRISEWSPELERLTDLVDRMGEVMVAVIASQGGKPPKLRPHARPRTAIDRLREKRRYEHHKKVVARVLIERADGTTTPVVVDRAATKRPKVTIGSTAASTDHPAIAPGEDPFRLRTPRSRPKQPPGGAITGEPKKPVE